MYVRHVLLTLGRARSGKGQIADRFEYEHHFVQLGFMNTMYRLFQAAYGTPTEKEGILREFLQQVGTGIVREFDQNFHTYCLAREAADYIRRRWPVPYIDVVINDGRTRQEGNKAGGNLARILEEVVGRPPKKIVSCFVEVAPVFFDNLFKLLVLSHRVLDAVINRQNY